jgi:hypothetical protein
MNEQYRELLFIDLCGRLPYKVRMFEIEPINDIQSNLTLQSITNKESVICITPSGGVIGSSIDAFKPYLFPLSSMTEEQKKELDKKFNVIAIYGNNILIHYHSQGYWDTDLEVDFQDWLWLINWLNKNHFDYKGLIEKELAIDCTKLNIY